MEKPPLKKSPCHQDKKSKLYPPTNQQPEHHPPHPTGYHRRGGQERGGQPGTKKLRSEGLDFEKVFACRFQKIRTVGRGAYGKVFTVLDKENPGETRALKVEHIEVQELRQSPAHFVREVDVLASLQEHPNVVRIIDVGRKKCDNDEYCWILMEYIPHTVYKVFTQRFTKRLKLLKLVLYDTLVGLYHMHTNGLAHRDIKPSNLLFDKDRLITKLCDFGMAKDMRNTSHSLSVSTLLYKPPEILAGCMEYNQKMDIWSLGVSALDVICGGHIFNFRNDDYAEERARQKLSYIFGRTIFQYASYG